MGIPLAAALTGGLSTLVDAGTSIFNTWKTNKTNKDIADQNIDFQKENLQYQKDLQEKLFNREDNAVQRRVDDLVAAGLSPTLAAGSAANAGQAIDTQAPQNGYSPKTMPNLGLSSMLGAGLDALRSVGELNKQKAEIDYLQNQSDNVKADTANKLIFGDNADQWYKARNYGLDLDNVKKGFSNEILEATKENQIKAQQYKTDLLNNELYWSNWDVTHYSPKGMNPKYIGSMPGLIFSSASGTADLLDRGLFGAINGAKKAGSKAADVAKNAGEAIKNGAGIVWSGLQDALFNMLFGNGDYLHYEGGKNGQGN